MDSFGLGEDENQVEAEAVHELLEEGWFYGRPRMLRCYSDPTPNFGQQSFGINEKSPSSGIKSSGKLCRAPSLPPCIGREVKIQEKKMMSYSSSSSSSRVKKLTRQMSYQGLVQEPITKPFFGEKKKVHDARSVKVNNNNITEQSSSSSSSTSRSLQRTPSLPPNIGREEDMNMIEGNESDITMSLLIRQAMPNPSSINLPKPRNPQVIMPRYRPPRNSEVVESSSSNERTRHKAPKRKDFKKSFSDVQFQEVKAGFTFDKEDDDPFSSSVFDESFSSRRRSLPGPGSCHVQSCSSSPSSSSSSGPPIPIWAPKNSTQDMKAQLKFWARAVASNVR